MKRLKLFFITILISCLVITGSIFAAQSDYNLALNQVKILINDEKVPIDTILFNNTTYVPVRKIAELFNKTIKWSNYNRTVNIIDKKVKTNSTLKNLKTGFLINQDNNNLSLKFQFRNISNNDIKIKYNSMLYDFIIYDKNNLPVYKDSLNNSYITAIVDITIPAKGNKIIEENINIMDIPKITKGTYKIVFIVNYTHDSIDYEVKEEAFFNVNN